jgi:amino acid permease
MEENINTTPKTEEIPHLETQKIPQLEAPKTETPSSNKAWILIVVAIVIIGLLVTGIIILFNQEAELTTRIRDIFIIFMALESLVIGAALTILIIQLATLINLLQNEVKPIIDSTNQTVNTLRGTATFISDNLSEPIIKINEFLAYLKKIADLLNIGRQ